VTSNAEDKPDIRIHMYMYEGMRKVIRYIQSLLNVRVEKQQQQNTQGERVQMDVTRNKNYCMVQLVMRRLDRLEASTMT